MRPTISAINKLEASYTQLDDNALRELFAQLRHRAQSEPLDQLIVETFAIVREASKRTIGLRHFDVQLIGGLALHCKYC